MSNNYSVEMNKKVRDTLSYWDNEYLQFVPKNATMQVHHKIWACGVVHIKLTGSYPSTEDIDGYIKIHGGCV